VTDEDQFILFTGLRITTNRKFLWTR